jgi:hypothetical protein
MRIAGQNSWYLHLMGKYEKAETMHQPVLTAREKVLGAEHPITMASVINLSNILNRQGNYEEVEVIH